MSHDLVLLSGSVAERVAIAVFKVLEECGVFRDVKVVARGGCGNNDESEHRIILAARVENSFRLFKIEARFSRFFMSKPLVRVNVEDITHLAQLSDEELKELETKRDLALSAIPTSPKELFSFNSFVKTLSALKELATLPTFEEIQGARIFKKLVGKK